MTGFICTIITEIVIEHIYMGNDMISIYTDIPNPFPELGEDNLVFRFNTPPNQGRTFVEQHLAGAVDVIREIPIPPAIIASHERHAANNEEIRPSFLSRRTSERIGGISQEVVQIPPENVQWHPAVTVNYAELREAGST